MDKDRATREARIGALYQGGEWYVTRWKRGCYKALPHDRYRGSIDGRIVDTFTPEKVRRTVPPSLHKKPSKATLREAEERVSIGNTPNQ